MEVSKRQQFADIGPGQNNEFRFAGKIGQSPAIAGKLAALPPMSSQINNFVSSNRVTGLPLEKLIHLLVRAKLLLLEVLKGEPLDHCRA